MPRLIQAASLWVGLRGSRVLEAHRQHRAASSTAHCRQMWFAIAEAAYERELVLGTDRSTTARAAILAALKARAIRHDVPEATALLPGHYPRSAGFGVVRREGEKTCSSGRRTW